MASTTLRMDPHPASNPAVWPPAALAELERLHEQALERAATLREQAMAKFWRDTDAWLSDAVTTSRRSADRLAARLRQHAKLRARGSRTIGV